MIRVIRKVATRAYESAVAWTVVFAIVRTAGNILVLPLMLRKLPSENLGLWYVFLSLAGISSLVDMGFLATMSRATAYLWAGAREIRPFGTAVVEESGDESAGPNYPLLADLSKTMRFYYFGLGILITALIGTCGTVWIARKVAAWPDANAVLWAWLIFLFGIFINVVSAVWHPLLIGINRVRLAQQIMVWGLGVNYLITCLGLLLGAGLFAPVAGYLAMGLLTRVLSRIAFRRLTRTGGRVYAGKWSGQILRALWPTAWRTGIVSLGIYATLNASTLVCSVYLGLKVTASFGLSMQLILAALSIATGFFAVKLPMIAQLHARGKAHEIAPLVFPRLRWFWSGYAALAAVAILFGEPVLSDLFHSQTPLLPRPILVALFVVIGLEGHHAVFREITVASNQNPFAGPVVISGVLIVLLEVALVRWVGLWALVLAPGLIQLAFNNWWTVLVGLRSMRASAGEYFASLLGFKVDYSK